MTKSFDPEKAVVEYRRVSAKLDAEATRSGRKKIRHDREVIA